MALYSGGDILAVQKESEKPFAVDVDVATGDSSTKSALVAAIANWTIYVQKITMSVITDAAQSLSVQDNANTPVVIAKNKVSPGAGPIVWDFGPHGTALTRDKQLDLAISGAGLAARVHIEGYQKLGTAIKA